MTRTRRHAEMPKLALLTIVTILIIACGGGGGGGDGPSNTTPTTENIFPTDEDSMSSPTGVSTITIDDVDLEVASKEIIAIFKDSATPDDYSNLIDYLNNKGYEKIGQIPEMGLVQILVNTDDEIQLTINELSNLSYIERAFANFILEESSSCPVEENVVYGEGPSFQGDEWLSYTKVREAWKINTGCADIRIGIIDSYVNVLSESLNGKDVSILNSGAITSGHGTTVAAIAASKSNDKITGVARECPIYCYSPEKNDEGNYEEGENFHSSGTILFGGKILIDIGVKVVNISIGKNFENPLLDFRAIMQTKWRSSLSPLVNLAEQNDTLIILAVGNDDSDNPLRCDNTLLEEDDRSNEPNWDSNAIIVTTSYDGISLDKMSGNDVDEHGVGIRGDVVDIAAPTWRIPRITPRDNGSDEQINVMNLEFEGSSFAAPQVTGAAALIYSLNPDLPAATVKQILISNATQTDSIPILNVYAALQDPDIGYTMPDSDGDGVPNHCDPDYETTWYQDSDGDGYGAPNYTVQSATQPTGYVDNDLDWDDGDSTISPGSPEICNDEKDNDQDGSTDCDDTSCSGDASCIGDIGDDVTEGLVLDYNFEETDCSVVDQSGNGIDGTVIGATCVEGEVGQAMSFDGTDDYVLVDNDDALKISDDSAITLSAWVKADAIGSNMAIIAKEQGDALEYLMALHNTGKIYFTGESNSITNWGTLSQSKVQEDQWVHLAAVRDGNDLKIYFNGQIDLEETTNVSVNSTNGDAKIGGNLNGGPWYFDGQIDEARIYNKALTATEISNLYSYYKSWQQNPEPEDSTRLIPDTGQTTSFTATFGEDSDYTINPPSYTKLDSAGNTLSDSATSWAMVKDNVTGLIWEVKNDDGGIHDKDNTYSWQDSNNVYIVQLNNENFGGRSDWRLPTVIELFTITNKGSYDPPVDTTFFPNTRSNVDYWTSTISSGDTSWAKRVGFLNGTVTATGKSANLFVRAVCGEQVGSNLVDNGDGTITDNLTGLMWQKAEAGFMDWDSAINYCESLDLANHNDWRLPNINEIQSIVDYEKYYPSIDTTFFPEAYSNSYWSSTTRIDVPVYAFTAYFSGGDIICVTRKETNVYVRAVRSGSD